MATQKSNITPWSYYSVIFGGLLLIMFFFASTDPGEKSIESEPVTRNELVSESPQRPVIPQEPPVDIIIEDEISEYILTAGIAEADAVNSSLVTSVASRNKTTRRGRAAKLHFTAAVHDMSYPVATPERPVLPAVEPVDIVIDDPIFGLMIPAVMKHVSQVTPPHPTVPAEVPVDVIITDPIVGLDINL